MTFRKWVIDKYKDADTPRGDFARDCGDDKQFPMKNDYSTILLHLTGMGACYQAIGVFRSLWLEYCRHRKQEAKV